MRSFLQWGVGYRKGVFDIGNAVVRDRVFFEDEHSRPRRKRVLVVKEAAEIERVVAHGVIVDRQPRLIPAGQLCAQ